MRFAHMQIEPAPNLKGKYQSIELYIYIKYMQHQKMISLHTGVFFFFWTFKQIFCLSVYIVASTLIHSLMIYSESYNS